MSELYTVRPMQPTDLATVLGWRNHPDIRRYMYTQHEITPEEHRQWFERVSLDKRRHLLLFEHGKQSRGFISLHESTAGGVADWGFYLAPDAPSGSGVRLGCAALDYAFEVARLHKVCGQALSFNARSVRLHQRLGFTHEGLLRQQHFDGQVYQDVLCFGLLAGEWSALGKGVNLCP